MKSNSGGGPAQPSPAIHLGGNYDSRVTDHTHQRDHHSAPMTRHEVPANEKPRCTNYLLMPVSFA
jgi:hypothetical protein